MNYAVANNFKDEGVMKIEKKRSNIFLVSFFSVATAALTLSGCGGGSGAQQNDQQPPLSIGVGGVAPVIDPITAPPVPDSGLNQYGYPGCGNSSGTQLCLGLKVVSYFNSSNQAVISEVAAVQLVRDINSVWSQCNIAFQLEKYSLVNPNDYGLDFNPNWTSQASQIRKTFEDGNRMVVIAVGQLSGSTIAVTEMPGGSAPYGVLVEQDYAKNAYTVGHELGHYLGLYHISNSSNLMNAYIGSNTKGLTESQCTTAWDTETSFWKQMLR